MSTSNENDYNASGFTNYRRVKKDIDMYTTKKIIQILFLFLLLLSCINSNAQEQKSFYQMMQESDAKVENYWIEYYWRKTSTKKMKRIRPRTIQLLKRSPFYGILVDSLNHFNDEKFLNFQFNPIADTVVMILGGQDWAFNYQIEFLMSSKEAIVSYVDHKYYPVRQDKINPFVTLLREGHRDAFLDEFCQQKHFTLDVCYIYYLIPIVNNRIVKPVISFSGREYYLDGLFAPYWEFLPDVP
jgi:hypothetical protein